MFWTIVGAILFVIIGIPVIIILLASILPYLGALIAAPFIGGYGIVVLADKISKKLIPEKVRKIFLKIFSFKGYLSLLIVVLFITLVLGGIAFYYHSQQQKQNYNYMAITAPANSPSRNPVLYEKFKVVADDRTVLSLTRAIRENESGWDGKSEAPSNPYLLKYEDGRFGAYGFSEEKWHKYALKYAGNENVLPTAENQDMIAYLVIYDLWRQYSNLEDVFSVWKDGVPYR